MFQHLASHIWAYLCTISIALLLPIQIVGQWISNPQLNNPLCTAPTNQDYHEICSDGLGGAIMAWRDNRNGNSDIYAQRIDATGTCRWGQNGVAVCTAGNGQRFPYVCSDGSGGAIVTWVDGRQSPTQSGDNVFAQRIDANGVVKWMTNGVAVCTAPSMQQDVRICHDGSGGAIISWADHRFAATGPGPDIYAQRVDAAGVVQWTADGIVVANRPTLERWTQICPDGSGGAVIIWWDNNVGGYDLYAQRVNSSGTTQWQANGIALRVGISFNGHYEAQLCPDGTGGAIVTWPDYRSGTNHDIYAQRVNGAGQVMWSPNGQPVCNATRDQVNPELCTDGSGGVIITWYDYRSSSYDIYAQRVNSSGAIQWIVDGTVVCNALHDQSLPKICTDGSGGAIITWMDDRSGSPPTSHSFDVYAQRISSTGSRLWVKNGIPVSTAFDYQTWPCICSDGMGGAIVAWGDYRSGTADIYASCIGTSGQLVPVELATFSAVRDHRCIRLLWKTETERNNHGFTIERRSAETAWKDIGFVRGNGTSNVPCIYEYSDPLSRDLQLAYRLYYRLRQTDTDGREHCSPVVEVQVDAVPGLPHMDSPYPNPSAGQCVIPLHLPGEIAITLQLYSLLGKHVKTIRSHAVMSRGSHSILMDSGDLSNGSYFLEMIAGKVRSLRILSIQR